MATLTQTTYNGLQYNGTKTYNLADYSGFVIPGYNVVTYNRTTYDQAAQPSTYNIGVTAAATYNRITFNEIPLTTLTLPIPVIVIPPYGGYNSFAYMDIAYNDTQDIIFTFLLSVLPIVGTAEILATIGRIHMSVPTTYISLIKPADTRIIMYM